MVLYMRVTKDKYELPIAVAESEKELASMLGLSVKTIWDGFYRKSEAYKKVIVSGLEEEENE